MSATPENLAARLLCGNKNPGPATANILRVQLPGSGAIIYDSIFLALAHSGASSVARHSPRPAAVGGHRGDSRQAAFVARAYPEYFAFRTIALAVFARLRIRLLWPPAAPDYFRLPGGAPCQVPRK